MSDFWAKQLNGGQAPPPHIQQPPPQQTGAWWMTPAHPSVNPGTPPQQSPSWDSGLTPQETYQQLKGMRADQMDQSMMEALATIELQFDKYNHVCDQCQSTNFVPAGTKIGNVKMPTAKCFECGNSSGALCASPEPAVSGNGRGVKHTRQVAGGQGNYGQHHSQLPQGFIPTNRA